MAEALAVVGLASAIVQFVDFSTKVVKRLEDFQQRVEEVPKAFKSIRVQLPLLIDTLGKANEQLEATCISKDTQLKVRNVVQDCLSQVELLDTILAKTLPKNLRQFFPAGAEGTLEFAPRGTSQSDNENTCEPRTAADLLSRFR